MRALARYAVVSLATITASAGLLALAFRSPLERRALLLSAALAFVVQLGTFAIARAMTARTIMAGWGAGALLRFATLALAALAVVGPLGLPREAALVGLALFLFVSTLMEPWLLAR